MFQSPLLIGTRLATLLLSLAPIFGSIIAWMFFGGVLTALQTTDNILSLRGIAWVVLSHEAPPDTHTNIQNVAFSSAYWQPWARRLGWSFRSKGCLEIFPRSRRMQSVCWQLSFHVAVDRLRRQRCSDLYRLTRESAGFAFNCPGRISGTTGSCNVFLVSRATR